MGTDHNARADELGGDWHAGVERTGEIEDNRGAIPTDREGLVDLITTTFCRPGDNFDVELAASGEQFSKAWRLGVHTARGVAKQEIPPLESDDLAAICGGQHKWHAEAQRRALCRTQAHPAKSRGDDGCLRDAIEIRIEADPQTDETALGIEQAGGRAGGAFERLPHSPDQAARGGLHGGQRAHRPPAGGRGGEITNGLEDKEEVVLSP